MKTLNVKQAAARLGMCEKTLSTVWVRRGILQPIPGTAGQGRTMLFDSAAVQAFKENADLVEFVALCRWGWTTGKGSDLSRAAAYFGDWRDHARRPVFRAWWQEFAFRSVYDNGGRLLYRHPHGWDLVPPGLHAWAVQACRVLSRRETECLAAVFIAASVKPPPAYNEAAFHAEWDWVKIVGKRNSLAGVDFQKYDNELQGLGLREVGIWDRETGPLRRFCKRWFPEEPGMFRRLCAWVKMHQKTDTISRRFPGAAAVGRVMQIQRAQAGQLVKRTLRKLHAAGVPNGIYEPPAPVTPSDKDEDDYFTLTADRAARRGIARHTISD